MLKKAAEFLRGLSVSRDKLIIVSAVVFVSISAIQTIRALRACRK
jgi:hypothetical protein